MPSPMPLVEPVTIATRPSKGRAEGGAGVGEALAVSMAMLRDPRLTTTATSGARRRSFAAVVLMTTDSGV